MHFIRGSHQGLAAARHFHAATLSTYCRTYIARGSSPAVISHVACTRHEATANCRAQFWRGRDFALFAARNTRATAPLSSCRAHSTRGSKLNAGCHLRKPGGRWPPRSAGSRPRGTGAHLCCRVLNACGSSLHTACRKGRARGTTVSDVAVLGVRGRSPSRPLLARNGVAPRVTALPRVFVGVSVSVESRDERTSCNVLVTSSVHSLIRAYL